jgi:hypothetical protein
MRLCPKNTKELKWAGLRLLVVLVLIVVVPVAGAFWSASMPGQSHAGSVPAPAAEQARLQAALQKHVEALAGTIGVRSRFLGDTLGNSARYIASELAQMGYTPVLLPYDTEEGEAANVVVELPGTTEASEIVVVGAHYDTVLTTPGADDNASGVAVLLETARALAGRSFPRTIRFVAFANEEPPYFQTGEMGSLQYARHCRKAGDDVVAMYSLESLGYFDDEPGSQMYPPPFSLIYPEEGSFVGFVGDLASRHLVQRAVRLFREMTPVPSEGLAGPSWIPGVDLSDHWAFWQEDYPALMITDTALFRNPHYHKAGDLPSVLDFERMTWVASGVIRIVEDVANR